MSSKFEQVVRGVDVFEVGIFQAKELLADTLYVDSYKLGDYVIVASMSGYRMPLHGVYSCPAFITLDETVDFVLARDCENLMSLKERRRFGIEREVWHLVDDADLWQAWEHDSAVACKDGGQPTDYHVYEAYKCVLDLVREVPPMLYSVTVVDDANEVVGEEWYSDADKWAQAVNGCDFNGNLFMSLELQSARELGLYIVDDWDNYEGLEDGVDVLNAYFHDYRCE